MTSNSNGRATAAIIMIVAQLINLITIVGLAFELYKFAIVSSAVLPFVLLLIFVTHRHYIWQKE